MGRDREGSADVTLLTRTSNHPAGFAFNLPWHTWIEYVLLIHISKAPTNPLLTAGLVAVSTQKK